MNTLHYDLWLFALDPVHVGAGGIQLSHVDMEIIRDPGDNLPKIPASTLSGNVRANAASYWRNEAENNPFCAGLGASPDNDGKDQHCGACPVCYGFGTSRENMERMGAFSFQDALLVFFPLYSMTHGPVWITSHQRRKQVLDSFLTGPDDWNDDEIYTTWSTAYLSLGRRLITLENGCAGSVAIATNAPVPLRRLNGSRLAVVPDNLFSSLVNENLETRTSVSIDPLTGTAKTGALFTYEALPRASLLLSGVTVNQDRWTPPPDSNSWPEPGALLEQGLAPLALCGIGGMGSRGFGRLEHSLLQTGHENSGRETNQP